MTIASMTGFARAGGSAGGIEWNIEIKSVNGRGLDVRLKLAQPFDRLESDLRAAAQKRFARGNIQVLITAKGIADSSAPQVNEAVFAAYAATAERLAWSAKLTDATVGDILRLPGVVETASEQGLDLTEEVTAQFLASFDEALNGLSESRRGEGQALASVLSAIIDQLALGAVAAAEADVLRLGAVKARLKAQIEILLESSASFDPDRLHQEAVLLASRMDVREELDRLNAHIAQARSLLKSREAVGRRLDFLAQELVRETNTLCAKSNDIALTRIGLDLKASVEQFREQVQNIE